MNDEKPSKDIRWVQRFENYAKALRQLKKFIDKRELNELEQQGMIKCFEYTYELAWNTLKDLLEWQGESNILGSRDAFRLAFKRGLIVNGEAWMEMIKSRGLTSHTYDEKNIEAITTKILNSYFSEFLQLHDRLQVLSKDR